jgi:predicted RNase H-like HicB family nuclease
MPAYIAFLRKDPDSDYGVEFPDLPGCVSAGHTAEEARVMAAEALAGHVSVLQEMGQAVPPPTPLDALTDHPDRGDAALLVVDLDPDVLKDDRIDVTLPRALIGRIDAVAGSGNRSRFLAQAAERHLAE